MLQPRVTPNRERGFRGATRMAAPSLGLCFVIIYLLSGFATCQESHADDSIAADRVKRDVGSDGDLTTVLLVDNQKLNRDINARNGRYLNVKPVIGLLTSTARTFIQDGVTTEYATEILGTTLDNGRVYAQLLTKSSLVLYNKPAGGGSQEAQVRKTRLPFEMDDRNKWNLEQSLGEVDGDKFVVKNTDYVSPNADREMFTVFASKPSQGTTYSSVWSPTPAVPNDAEEPEESDRVQGLKEVPRYSEFEAFNFLDPLPSARERKISTYNNVNIGDDRTNKAIGFDKQPENVVVSVKKSQSKAIDPVKVNPDIKLPTYTVKNEFSPIFYYIDNVESKTEKTSSTPNYLKNAKKLFGHKDEHKQLKTFTYYGFANFTTIVGDTVIVFSPSTSSAFVKTNDITPSAKPEVQPNVATRLKTFLSSDLNMVTKTMFGHNLNMETALPTIVMNPQEASRSSKALINQQNKLKSVLYEKPTDEVEQSIKPEDKFSRVISSLKEGLFNRQKTQFGLTKEAVQPSETSYSTIHRSHATDKLQPSEETSRDDKIYTIKPTEPLTLYRPSTVKDVSELEDESSSAVTESNQSTVLDEDFTEETGPTTESDYETSPYTDDTLSTPNIDEESKDDHSGDATCTNGIIPVSTMTTAYKTFTYLTSYFIPLEGTETSTSIKSHEVVSSETGYLTNLVCKTDESVKISPTVTLDVLIKPTKTVKTQSSKTKEDSTEPNLPTLTTTEKQPETTTEKKPETTTSKSNKRVEDVTENKINLEDKTTDFPTTESIISTSESHVEMSVTTEETSTPSLNNRNNFETTTESKEEAEPTTEDFEEGEIDLIFKTLYTTYTYFTTYFQGSTSTVTSKKSVITNVITSTLDLSEIDPSIFNAIESSDYLFKATQREELGDIVPTSVGVGRPTETFSLNSIIDLVQHRQVIDSVQNDPVLSSKIATPKLQDEKLLEDINADAVKTFYTTYTFFTTLYVEQDINICSRSEVYTNYVGPASLIPTKTSDSLALKTNINEIDFKSCKKVPADHIKKPELDKDDDDLDTDLSKPKYHIYTSIDRPKKDKSNESEGDKNEIVLNRGDSMLVTDIKSSSSKGDHQIIDNGVLEDQISSESNIDEIMPSPTLLLQTSYTTFTYFTTMYVGKDSSKIKSRLETVTNVVTETLDPKSAEVEESNLPITYYTTFTYWTTLYKDKTTTITSREDIISNVVTPSVQQKQQSVTVSPIDTSPIEVATVQIAATSKEASRDEISSDIKPSTTVDDLLSDDGKATFFTTYTYFTTYYIGNTSELRSSLETITNVVDPTKDPLDGNELARAVGKEPAGVNLLGDNEKPIIKSTKLPDEIVPTQVVGVSTILPTQIVGTYENVVYPSKDQEKKIISSQVAVISGDSTIITSSPNENKTITIDDLINANQGTTVIEGTVTEPTTPQDGEEQEGEEEDEEEDDGSGRKKSRLTFSSKKRTFTPIIRPFLSRSRPTFVPARVPLTSGATTITRSDFTPTITATPALKSSKSSGFGGNRKQSASAYPGSQAGGRRFSRVSTTISPTVASSSTRSFGRGGQQSTSRRGSFRTSSVRQPVIDASTRVLAPRIRPTLSSRYRGNKQTTTPTLNNEEDASVTENPSGSTDNTDASTQSSTDSERKSTSPLLRFRRPPFTRAPIATTPRSTTQSTTRRSGSFNRNRAAATTTTPKPTQRSTLNPLFALRNRQRPNSLFPPRGLINKPEPQPAEEAPAENEEKEEGEDLEEEGDEDSEYESSDRLESQVTTTTTTQAPRRLNNAPIIRPFNRLRSKRQATDYGQRRSYSNFRRPTTRTPRAETVYEPEPEITTPAPRSRSHGRFISRNSVNSATQPTTRAPAATSRSSNARQPFILRRDDGKTTSVTQRPSFRTRNSRPVSKPSSSPTNLRPKAPKLRTEPTRSSSRGTSRSRTTARTRNTSRYRTTSNDIVDSNYINYQIPNDGKLTITHKIPIEVTIPVVNGKLTEYKNVLTAKPSIEVLLPNEYSTTKNSFGSQYTVLVSESSELAENGATRVIQFVLHETPTTSVIFTPTTIRGRRTSFSHIIPSTVYEVERVTSTIQPQINPNVPLANILLSQLLLNPIVMPQPINPLFPLQGPQGVPGTPTTEFKTKTTTYVTTVTDTKSTVLPITFRGKEILTTIVESSVDVITATEFITETVVVTPTVGLPNQNQNQINSILLLLQQQQQFQPQPQPTINPLAGLGAVDLNAIQVGGNDLLNNPKLEVLDVNAPDDYPADYVEEEITPAPKRNSRRKLKVKKPTTLPQSSVITLYVSGRTPGEFSTVLSTVVVQETQSVQKREAVYFDDEFELRPSDLPNYANVLAASQSDMMLDNFLMPASEDEKENAIVQSETQSLESIVGEVSKYMTVMDSSSAREMGDPTLVYVVDKVTASS